MPRDEKLHNPVEDREGYGVSPEVFVHQHIHHSYLASNIRVKALKVNG